MHSAAQEISEIIRLNTIRLEEDLPVAELAKAIGLERSALHRLLFEQGREPRDRTLHKIRKFLERYDAKRARKRAKGRQS